MAKLPVILGFIIMLYIPYRYVYEIMVIASIKTIIQALGFRATVRAKMKTRQFVKFDPRAMKFITFSRGVGTFLILGGGGGESHDAPPWL